MAPNREICDKKIVKNVKENEKRKINTGTAASKEMTAFFWGHTATGPLTKLFSKTSGFQERKSQKYRRQMVSEWGVSSLETIIYRKLSASLQSSACYRLVLSVEVCRPFYCIVFLNCWEIKKMVIHCKCENGKFQLQNRYLSMTRHTLRIR